MSGLLFSSVCIQPDLSVNSVGQKFSSRAENHLCERSMWIILLLESKAAQPTLQTLLKLMRTEIQALRDMGLSQNATESVHRRTAAVWGNGCFCSTSVTDYYCALQTFPVGRMMTDGIAITVKKQMKRKVHATTDKAGNLPAEEHLQAECCGLITSAVFQIKQTRLRQTSDLCALAVYLT